MITNGVEPEPAERVFAGYGEVPGLCRTIDWSATSLGDVTGWPPCLRAAVRMSLDAATVPMAIWAGQERTVIYNQCYAEVLGAPTHPRALGRPAREVWPDAWPQLGPQLTRVLEAGECVQVDGALVPLAPSGGEQRGAMSSAFVPVRDEHGAVVAALHVVQAAPKRVEAANAMAESDDRFQRLIADVVPQVVWLAGPDGRIHYINERNTELSGVRKLADGTWSWADVLVPEDRAATIEAWATAVRNGTEYEIAHRLMRTDGTIHWYLNRAIPVRDAANRIVQWFGTATDIESQKRAEQAIREADRHKSDFLAWLAHELRNPIGIIHTSLVLIERAGLASEQAHQVLPVMRRQVTQVERLLQDLLDIARISKGKILLRREFVDLNDIVRSAGDDHRPVFDHEGIGFDVTVGDRPLRANVDRARITQAIGNLLQNASKFTPKGGHVVLSIDAAESNTATIEVRDNGPGLAPDMLTRLFEPLVQDVRTIHRSRGGLGLGLALVKQLAELHGGAVSASNDVARSGAVFTIRLPLEPQTA